MLQTLLRLAAFLTLFAAIAPQSLFLMQGLEIDRGHGMDFQNPSSSTGLWMLMQSERGRIIIERRDGWGNRSRVLQSQ